MVVLLLIICCVVIGLAYADYCMIDNVEHFGRCFGRAATHEAEMDISVASALEDSMVDVAAAGLAATAGDAMPDRQPAAGSCERAPTSLPARRPARAPTAGQVNPGRIAAASR